MSCLLEVIAFTIESCRQIEQSGGGRIELCANPQEGGTTVSYGMMKEARKSVQIPIFPIIRPRGGDFLYNESEYAIMKEDILQAKNLGMDGIVIGLLNKNGTIDRIRTASLVELAYPLEVTFHRAFDRVPDQFLALEVLIETGCDRVLTSGGYDTAPQGLAQLSKLVRAADERIIILPGSGIRSGNIGNIASVTGLSEFHTSARILCKNRLEYDNVQMNEPLDTYTVNPEEIKACIAALAQKKGE